MSIPFSDSDTFQGAVQFYENEIGANYGDVSGNEQKLKEFTARANLAKRNYFAIAVQAAGTWELDDSGHDDYDIIYGHLTSGQRDYQLLTDDNGNQILDVYKVLVLPSTGSQYQEIYPVDENNEGIAIVSNTGITGVPMRYGKRANAIFLDPVPNYSLSRGIKVLINRESSYYDYTDTDKTFGYPYHEEYVFLKPAYDYARINNLATFPRLEREILKLEGDVLTGRVGLIAKAYGNRKKDEIDSFSGEIINSI